MASETKPAFKTAKKKYWLIHKYHYQDAAKVGVFTSVANTAYLETFLL